MDRSSLFTLNTSNDVIGTRVQVSSSAELPSILDFPHAFTEKTIVNECNEDVKAVTGLASSARSLHLTTFTPGVADAHG